MKMAKQLNKSAGNWALTKRLFTPGVNSREAWNYLNLRSLRSLRKLREEHRATDNAIIERFFGTLKRKQFYLYPAKDGLELYSGVEKFMKKYNLKNHSGINQKISHDLYLNVA